ncbi:hypothetical protein F5884DRAFT_245515 [Xylogone sp. PMI_703]|nr:hypothetical protein F5884DRAFT_245515 [Xylogone sp. PMI_703]
MGAASKTLSVLLRFWELACAAIVAGIFGRFLHILDVANVGGSSRIIYAEVIAGISIVAALVLFPPLRYSFWCFPVDFILWVCWLVAFGLVVNLTGTNACHSYWYWTNWGYYWGGFWRRVPVNVVTQSVVGGAGCAQWKTAVAFAFMGAWGWFFSALLGIYVCSKPRDEEVAGGQMSKISKTSHNIDHLYHKYTPGHSTGGENLVAAQGTAGTTGTTGTNGVGPTNVQATA